ncbi:hypothetical protein FQR65_LT01481 [Abscondita terminalis]|nr:hypothetical protein FQR65_LT01481 [Abscondita terminalis]
MTSNANLVILLLINSAFFTEALNITDKIYEFDVCYARIIDYLFGTDGLIHFIYESNTKDRMPFSLGNQKILLNAQTHFLPEYCIPGKNFVFLIDDDAGFGRMFSVLQKTCMWNQMYSPKGRFLIHYAINVIMMVYDKSDTDAVPKIYSLDMLHENNGHGLQPNFAYEQSCNSSLSSIFFHKPFRNFRRFPIMVLLLIKDYVEIYRKASFFRHFILDKLCDFINVSCVEYELTTNENLSNWIYKFHTAIASNYKMEDVGFLEKSQILSRDVALWIFPFPERISMFEVYIIIFHRNIWIMILVAFVSVTSCYWLINKRKISWSYLFIEFLRISLFNNVHTMPRKYVLRFLIMSYIVFSMHIQTAYVSKLIEVLTMPKYKNGISSINDLANSDSKIYMAGNKMDFYFMDKLHGDDLYTKIQRKVVGLREMYAESMAMGYLYLYNNVSVLVDEGIIALYEINTRTKITNKKVSDTLFPGHFDEVFLTKPGHFFMDTINKFLTVMDESGIIVEDWKTYNNYLEHTVSYNTPNKELVFVLALKHSYGIFVFLAVGLTLSLFAFVGELFTERHRRYNSQ